MIRTNLASPVGGIESQPTKEDRIMSQSLANIVVHLVFSTKGRRQLLRDEERSELHAYITGILKNHDSPAHEPSRRRREETRSFSEERS